MNKKKVISSVSKIYAKALYDVVKTENTEVSVMKQLDDICQIFENSNDLKILANNTSIAKETKNDVFDDLFKEKINKSLLNFIKVLNDKNRLSELMSINEAYKTLLDTELNKKTVEIISATEVDTKVKSKIIKSLEKKLNAEIIPVWNIDKTLIAGLVYKFDDYIIDTSLRAKLENLSKNILR